MGTHLRPWARNSGLTRRVERTVGVRIGPRNRGPRNTPVGGPLRDFVVAIGGDVGAIRQSAARVVRHAGDGQTWRPAYRATSGGNPGGAETAKSRPGANAGGTANPSNGTGCPQERTGAIESGAGRN